jgi:hypothetical protein
LVLHSKKKLKRKNNFADWLRLIWTFKSTFACVVLENQGAKEEERTRMNVFINSCFYSFVEAREN